MKQTMNNLRDYAELAQASYFYFDFLKDSNNIPRKIYKLDSSGNKIKDENSTRGYKGLRQECNRNLMIYRYLYLYYMIL